MRQEVLGVDFDKAGSAADAMLLHLKLRLAGIQSVLCSSGGISEDGQPKSHVIAMMRNVDERMRWQAVAKALGGDVRENGTRGLRPPGALHRSRTARSTPVLPNSLHEVEKRIVDPRRVKPLNARILDLIQAGVAKDDDRSQPLTRVVAALYRAKWTSDETLALLKCSKFGISTAYLGAREDRSFEDDTYFTKYLWGWVEARITNTTLLPLDSYRAYSRMRILGSSRSKSRPAVLCVAEALMQIAERSGKAIIDASVRELSLRTQIASLATVNTALKVLEDLGLVVDVTPPPVLGLERGPMRLARTYRLCFDAVPLEYPHVFKAGDWILHETFRDKTGLGKWVGLIYQSLWDEPGNSVDGLVGIFGLNPVTVKSHLSALEKTGMAEVRGTRWYPGRVQPYEGQMPRAHQAAIRDAENVVKDRGVVLRISHDAPTPGTPPSSV
ncbi:hypothetical protein [Demequina aurantiaca]|uniref:hypothetical protein n=1 Tax=Demequina aurantiaca TaxID=676200 RepID=UPI003D34C133